MPGETPADLLRRAAAELRDAVTNLPPSPWAVRETAGGSRLTVISEDPSAHDGVGRPATIVHRASPIVVQAEVKRGYRRCVAFVALMQPSVARGMADLLDDIAKEADHLRDERDIAQFLHLDLAIVLARQILGEAS